MSLNPQIQYFTYSDLIARLLAFFHIIVEDTLLKKIYFFNKTKIKLITFWRKRELS